MTMHECKTYDGVVIKLGLEVTDYDGKRGTVVCVPSRWDLDDSECWPVPGHNGHWWGVCPNRENHVHEYEPEVSNGCRGKIFDGSRLLANKREWWML